MSILARFLEWLAGRSASNETAPDRRERVFYSGMVLAMLVVFFIGFSPSFFFRSPAFAGPSLTPLVHLHAAVAMGWLLMLLVQALLVAGLLLALGEHLNPPQTVVLRGAPDALKHWHARCGARYAPGRMALAIPADVTNLTGLLAERRVQGNITAYICSGHACQAPVSSFEEFENALRTSEAAG